MRSGEASGVPSGATAGVASDVPSGATVPLDVRFLAIGIYFGFVLMKGEVVSWYRVQEMFRFHAFHMYGVIGSAVLVAAVSVWIVRRLGVRSVDGRPIVTEPMPDGWRRYAGGGVLFGVGWALTGACPGPIAALIGAGLWPFTIVFLAAWLGTLTYGLLRTRLPH